MCSAPWYSASSVPRIAIAAGPSARSEPRASCNAGVRRDERSSLTPARVPIIATATRGRPNGSSASGRRRRTTGRSAKTSAIRRAPCTILFASFALIGFLPEASWSRPSPARMAQAQYSGPCTSTPFPRAMPPSRTALTCQFSVRGRRESASRTRGPRPESARPPSGSGARRARGPSCASERNRTRSSRTPREGSDYP